MNAVMRPASEWTQNTEGMFVGLPHQTYLDAPGLNTSRLGWLKDSPAHFQAALKEREEATVSQSMGTYLHNTILTPDAPLPGIAVKPPDRGFLNSNVGKAWKADAEARGCIILSEAEYATLKASIENLKNDRALVNMVANAWCEVSAWVKWPVGDESVLLKCRYDIVPKDWPLLMDLKTSMSAGAEAWGKACAEYGYHRQAAHYLRIWNALNPEERREEWGWVVVEKPWGLPWWTPAHPALIHQGERELDACLRKYVECSRSGEWPGRPDESTNLPLWYYKNASV